MKLRSFQFFLLTLCLVCAKTAQADAYAKTTPQQAVEADLRQTIAALEHRVKDLETLLSLARSEQKNDTLALREGVQAALNVIGEEIGSMRRDIDSIKKAAKETPVTK